MEIELNLSIAFGSMAILEIVILPIREHEISFPSFSVFYNFCL
jgi:hypothetical protein